MKHPVSFLPPPPLFFSLSDCLSTAKPYRCFWSKQCYPAVLLRFLSFSLLQSLRNFCPIPHFTTSLIQRCKILTAPLALNNSFSLMCCTPFHLTSLSSSSLHSIFFSHFFLSFYFFTHPLISLPSLSQNADVLNVKYQLTLLPPSLSGLLQWFWQVWWWRHAHTLHKLTRSHWRPGWDKMAGNRKWINLSDSVLSHAQKTHTHTYTHTNTHTAAAAVSVFTWKEKQTQVREREGEREREC